MGVFLSEELAQGRVGFLYFTLHGGMQNGIPPISCARFQESCQPLISQATTKDVLSQQILNFFFETQQVGLAEVIDASEASLGGPGGRAGKMDVNRLKVRLKCQAQAPKQISSESSLHSVGGTCYPNASTRQPEKGANTWQPAALNVSSGMRGSVSVCGTRPTLRL